MSFPDSYNDVLARIAKAAKSADRIADEISLTVVSKTFPAERIEPILAGGHRVFGENRVQEAEAKWPALKAAYPGTRLHLIGSLQTNKCDEAVSLFDALETVDREKLAIALAKSMDKKGRHPECFIQVNTGEEPQKGGISPSDAAAFAKWAANDIGLPVVGLMAIPPVDDPPAPHFALLHKLAEEAGLSRLSMGMSADFEIAVQLGATDVRVGSAIFGARG